MLLQEPAHSPYDLRFVLMGFPVRISWTFWLAITFFGYQLVQGLHTSYGTESPGMLPLLMLWALCMLVSILVHEMGHTFAYRKYGTNGSIVLYYLGGLATATGPSRSGRFSGGFTDKQQIWVSFAGPLAQMASALVLTVVVKAAGYQLWVYTWMPDVFQKIPGVLDGAPIENPGMFCLVSFYIYPSLLWALLNLVPVSPLDGGRIMESIVRIRGGNTEQSLWISVITAGLMAAYGFFSGQQFLGFLFLMLGVTNFQSIQQSGGRRY